MLELAFVLALQDGALESLREAHRLMERSEEDLHRRRVTPSEEKQREVIARLDRLIRDARQAAPKPGHRGAREAERDTAPRGDGPAVRPYTPTDTPPGKFVGREYRGGWPATLPPAMRESILHALAHIDEYPEDMRAVLREWSRRLAGGE
jgi:hypothetical protein